MKQPPAWLPSRSHKHQEAHALSLGLIWTEINSLETALRLFMCEVSGFNELYLQLNLLSRATVGTEVPLNHYTRKVQLKKLIEGFNPLALKYGFDPIDVDISDLRHALAHGRVSSTTEDSPIRILNFAPEENGKLVVCFVAVLTDEWVAAQKKRIGESTMRVYALSEAMKSTKR